MNTHTAQQIESLEDEYTAMARFCKENPAKWGHDEQEKMDKIGAALSAAYDAAGTDDFDRIQI